MSPIRGTRVRPEASLRVRNVIDMRVVFENSDEERSLISETNIVKCNSEER